uniref:Uncharacterized protein n=1 Tax=Anguilla anguilla TaxID=7936 RepID=A0A0E9PAI3_ANGAN
MINSSPICTAKIKFQYNIDCDLVH